MLSTSKVSIPVSSMLNNHINQFEIDDNEFDNFTQNLFADLYEQDSITFRSEETDMIERLNAIKKPKRNNYSNVLGNQSNNTKKFNEQSSNNKSSQSYDHVDLEQYMYPFGAPLFNSVYERKDDNQNTSSGCKSSISLICVKFLQKYKSTTCLIRIETAAEELGVHVRRVYDVLSILEYLLIVETNRGYFLWKGTNNLYDLFENIQQSAIDKYKFKYNLVSRLKVDCEKSCNQFFNKPERDSEEILVSRKRKISVEKENMLNQTNKFLVHTLCREFLELFLIGFDGITVQTAMAIISNDIDSKYFKQYSDSDNNSYDYLSPDYNVTIVGSASTKSRRLYDIANVLCEFGVLKRLQNEQNSRFKPPVNISKCFLWNYAVSPEQFYSNTV